jgi:hypothetical protein
VIASRLYLVSAALLLLVASPACGSDPESTLSPVAEAAVPSTPLDFTAPALGGGEIVGSDYAGRDLAIWFWAPW